MRALEALESDYKQQQLAALVVPHHQHASVRSSLFFFDVDRIATTTGQ